MRAFAGVMLGLVLAAGAVAAQEGASPTREQRQTSMADRQRDFDYLLGDWKFTAESAEWGRFGGLWSAVLVGVPQQAGSQE